MSIRKILKIQRKVLDPYKRACDEQDVISALQVHLKEELFILNTVLKAKDLMRTFLNKKLEQKFMNIVIKAEIPNMNKVDN